MTHDTPTRLDTTVFGRVQGVGFRYFVLRVATGLGLTGWVANTPEGAVRCVAEGPRDQLELLLDAIRVGPGSATVDRVSEAWMPPTGTLETFLVRSGAHPGD